MTDAAEAGLVAIIFSPLQALNLVEYSERFGHKVDVVVVGGVRTLEPASRTQIDGVLSFAAPRKIIYREWHIGPNRPRGARKAVVSAAAELRALLGRGPYEFVIGEYRSAFSWAVVHHLKDLVRNVVVVDDGTAMLRIDRRGSVYQSAKARRQKLKSLVFRLMGVRGVIPAPGVTFFTTYAIDERVAPGDAVVRHEYQGLSAELRALPPDEECVYVVGGPHLEAGEVDRGDIELALELTRFAAHHTGKKVVYMAHRRERSEKLEHLSKEVTVVTPEVPFELYPRVVGKRPKTIVGYYSSVFVTAAQLLGDSVEIVSLEIPRDRINESWHPFVDEVYRYYRTELKSAVRIIDDLPGSAGRRNS